MVTTEASFVENLSISRKFFKEIDTLFADETAFGRGEARHEAMRLCWFCLLGIERKISCINYFLSCKIFRRANQSTNFFFFGFLEFFSCKQLKDFGAKERKVSDNEENETTITNVSHTIQGLYPSSEKVQNRTRPAISNSPPKIFVQCLRII